MFGTGYYIEKMKVPLIMRQNKIEWLDTNKQL